MLVVYRVSSSKKDKWLERLDAMEEFIEDMRACIEEGEEEEVEYRTGSYRHDYEDEDYIEKPKSRYSKLNKRKRM